MEFIVKDSGTDSMDVCVAAAGVLGTFDALDYPVEDFKRVRWREGMERRPHQVELTLSPLRAADL